MLMLKFGVPGLGLVTLETLFQQNIWKLRLQLNRPGMIMAKKLNN